MQKSFLLSSLLSAALWLCGLSIASAESSLQLYVGAATADITPPEGAPLTGGHDVRFSKGVSDPLQANVVAIELRKDGKRVDSAILVAADLCVIRPGIQAGLREALGDRLGDFPKEKLVMTATHTHTAPVILQNRYKIAPDAVQPKDCVQIIYDHTSDAIEKAWKNRRPVDMAFGLGHAVTAQCRRVVYADGTAKMYGKIDTAEFRGLENLARHDVDCVYFFDKNSSKPMAILVGVWCPAQAGGGSHISADMWHPVREQVKAKQGEDVVVAGFCGPAGDMVPRWLLKKTAENRMIKLRGLSRNEEFGRRIANTVNEVLPVVADQRRGDLPMEHLVRRLELPTHPVKEEEYSEAKAAVEELDAKKEAITSREWRLRNSKRYIVDRYEAQQKGEGKHAVELHALRIGDLAIGTNPFELFVDYGLQIVARSKAPQTMLIQLAGQLDDHGYYLPTPDAIAGGSYSAQISSNPVGPEGGQMLVEESVEAINSLWSEGK